MTVKLICVGKLKERFWRDAAAEYEKRLSRFCRLETVAVPDEPGDASLSDGARDALLNREGARILAHVRETDYVVGLCIEGKTLDSPAFAESLAAQMVGGRSVVCFLIGGSWGLSDAVKSRCDLRLSMGRMTFPHQLARVMLLEQLYRAFKIMNREQYHK